MKRCVDKNQILFDFTFWNNAYNCIKNCSLFTCEHLQIRGICKCKDLLIRWSISECSFILIEPTFFSCLPFFSSISLDWEPNHIFLLELMCFHIFSVDHRITYLDFSSKYQVFPMYNRSVFSFPYFLEGRRHPFRSTIHDRNAANNLVRQDILSTLKGANTVVYTVFGIAEQEQIIIQKKIGIKEFCMEKTNFRALF